MKYLFFVILSLNIAASETNVAPLFSILRPDCQDEIKHICPNSMEIKYLKGCMHENEAKISTSCKEDISRIGSANKEVTSRGGGSLGSFGGFGLTPNTSSSLTYEGKTIPNHHIEPMTENKLSLQLPIFKEKDQTLSMATQVADLYIKNPLILSSGTNVPTHLYRTEMGINYMQMLAEKRSYGVRTSIGYNSDEVFKSNKDLSYSLTAHYSFGAKQYPTYTSSWALTLFMANNGPLSNYIPIPGFIYFYRTSTFTGIFGLPFISLQWTPVPPWSYSLSLFGTNLSAEIAYGSLENIQYFTGINMTKQSYMLHNRVNDKDRLNYSEKKIFIGARLPVLHFVNGEFQIGDSFGRRFSISNKLFQTQTDGLNIESSLYASCQLRLTF